MLAKHAYGSVVFPEWNSPHDCFQKRYVWITCDAGNIYVTPAQNIERVIESPREYITFGRHGGSYGARWSEGLEVKGAKREEVLNFEEALDLGNGIIAVPIKEPWQTVRFEKIEMEKRRVDIIHTFGHARTGERETHWVLQTQTLTD